MPGVHRMVDKLKAITTIFRLLPNIDHYSMMAVIFGMVYFCA